MKVLHKLFIILLLLPVMGWATESGGVLQPAPIDTQDAESLQRGAQTFVNYCLSCHSAQAMRYNRLQDLGLSEKQIKAYLIPTTAKVGDVMKAAISTADATKWFGVAPPDLSVIARARGADWLYGYLRSFYRDDSRPTGWNNLVFDKVGMPHVLWQLQGEQILQNKTVKNPDGSTVTEPSLTLVKPGTLTRIDNGHADQLEYDKKVADLVNYLVYMGEPVQHTRKQIGYIVLLFLLFIFVPLTYLLKKEYWKNIS
jgi:ubiquinol-cytochrome c reductase cytochrome c1 subunit